MGSLVGPALGAGAEYEGGQQLSSSGNPVTKWFQNIPGSVGKTIGTAAGGQPGLANVQQGTDVGDVQNAQKTAANSMEAQQGLLSALQNQNGLGLQSNLANQLQSANGVGTQNNAISGLQNAANMYGNIAQGQGPNPAQAMLNQQTGQNVANQAALMAGQRGAGANTGLLARQAGMQGANTQQQAVGQGATMQAQQALNALQGYTGAQSAIGGLGTTQAGMQAGMANQLAGQQIGQVNANTASALTNQGQMQNSLAGINQANVSNQASLNAGNTALANTALQGKQGLIGGFMNSFGSGISSMGASGGEVVKMADGGEPDTTPANDQSSKPSSDWGKYITMAMPILTANANPQDQAVIGFAKNAASSMGKKDVKMAEGGDPEFKSTPDAEPAQDTSSSEWGKYMGDAASASAAGGNKQDSDALGLMGTIGSIMAAGGGLADSGGHVKADDPSEKAVKAGNSYDNDKIDAKLSEGEIVLPRSVTMSEDPVAAAGKFVAETLANRKRTPGNMYADKKETVEKDENAADLNAAEKMENDEVAAQAPAPSQPAPVTPPAPVNQSQELPPSPPVSDNSSQENPDVLKQNAQEPPSDVSYVGSNSEDKAQELHNRAMDAAARKVVPKNMWSDKTVPQKIATIFGLMMSGAGSGLARQPNAALEMMNKIVERDLEAQKVNKEGGRNFLTMEADLANKNAHTAESYQRTFGSQIINDKAILQQADQLRANGVDEDKVQMWMDDQHKKNQMTYAPIMGHVTALGSVYQNLKDKYGNLPQAQAPLDELGRMIVAKQQQGLSKAGAINAITTQKSANDALAANKEEANNSGVLNQDLWRKGQLLSAGTDDLGAKQTNIKNTDPKTGRLLPGKAWVIEPSDLPLIPKETNRLRSLRADRDVALDVFGKLQKMPAGGENYAKLLTDFVSHPTAEASGSALDKFISPARQAELSRITKKYPELLNMFPSLGSSKGVEGSALADVKQLFKNKELGDEFQTLNKYPGIVLDEEAKAAPSKSPKSSSPSNKKPSEKPAALKNKEEKPWYEKYLGIEKVK